MFSSYRLLGIEDVMARDETDEIIRQTNERIRQTNELIRQTDERIRQTDELIRKAKETANHLVNQNNDKAS